MNAEILAVGTELLMGQIANTNAQFISEKLNSIGINVYYHSVVGDNPIRLKDSLKAALERSDIVIMTGGLGPTQDDLTKETVAEIVGRKLVLHKESLQKIEYFFKKIGRPMAKSNTKQAYFPEASIIIQNNNGTAPGCIIEHQDKVIIMLPGPPREMQPMFMETVIPYFGEKNDFRIVSRYLRVFGIGESSLEEMLLDLIDNQTNPTLATYAKEGEVTLRITAKGADEEAAEVMLEPVLEEVKMRLGNALYSESDENLEEVVGKLLIENNISIALAESCTGGLVSSKLTEVPGISAVLNRAVVSYSNQSKIEAVGVKPDTLKKYGAVSKETAEEMAIGIKEKSMTDIGLAITGIAGPDGGTPKKPVGLVYIALADENGVKVLELKLHGDRNRIRRMSALHALDIIRRHIKCPL